MTPTEMRRAAELLDYLACEFPQGSIEADSNTLAAKLRAMADAAERRPEGGPSSKPVQRLPDRDN